MLVRVAIYVLGTIFAFQAGMYLGEMSGPGRLTPKDRTSAATAMTYNDMQTFEPPPCPEVTEVVVEEPCPSSTQGHRPIYGPGEKIALFTTDRS